MTTPGVKFQFIDLNRPPIARLRTDICGFVLYAERGPTERAVKVTSWRQFLDTFGPPLDFAYGGEAVRLYFANSGAAAYVVRVSDPDAQATAALELVPGVTLSAAFSAIDRPAAADPGPLAALSTSTSANPGAWGNRLSVTVLAGGLGATRSLSNQPADGGSIRVEAIAGFQPGSWVRLVQNGDVHDRLARIAAVDSQLNEITWESPVTGPDLDYADPVRLESVEFTLLLALDGVEQGRYRNLSLDAAHPRYLPRVLEAEAPLLAGAVDPGALGDLADEQNTWPAPGRPVNLGRGADGLATVGRADFLAALKLLEPVDEVAVLAAPDVILRAEPAEDELPPDLGRLHCESPEAPPDGKVRGKVVAAGSGTPLAGVAVSDAAARVPAGITDLNGEFLMQGLAVGQATLRFAKPGYLPLEQNLQTFAYAPPSPTPIEMAPRLLPPPLATDEIFEVQQAMLGQGERGLYRVALLDPPEDKLRIEDIQSWRARFDSSCGALFWPWLVYMPEGETEARMLPPSGAMAGLLARLDLAEGPQRSPANRPLRAVQAVSAEVDDATHGQLNDLGINVLRPRPGRGIAPMGARTLSSDSSWLYLGVRRLMLMIAEAIEEGHQWAVFEPNTRALRDAISHSLRAFLTGLWHRGALAGAAPEAAFAIKCDEENNPPAVVNEGQLVAEVAVAPVKPYEFIRLRIGRADRLRVQVQE
jgi:hypothetical protein